MNFKYFFTDKLSEFVLNVVPNEITEQVTCHIDRVGNT